MRLGWCLLLLLLLSAGVAPAAVISTVPVGDAGNAPNEPYPGLLPHWSFGDVDHAYRIATYEVTNSQYAEFLNAKAKSDPLQLYDASMTAQTIGGINRQGSAGNYSYSTKPNMGNKPVNFVTVYDAMRFSNWLHNGQGNGDTESGAYTLTGGAIPVDPLNIVRNAGARWHLPSMDEWYKAAYYQPAAAGGDADNYWLYPTGTNNVPTQAFINSPTFDIANPGPNVANYDSGVNFVTTVGSAGPLSTSYYGTYDQGGNVSEWTDSIGFDGVSWNRLGGNYNATDDNMMSTVEIALLGSNSNQTTGFRVASALVVPEPGTLTLAAAGLGALAIASFKRARRSTKRPA